MKLSEHGVISEEALLAYINNGLTAEEKQELEKLLQNDPFAQDALEGLQQANKTTAATAVININKKVRERAGIKEVKGVKLHWSAYAWAAVVFGLLIGIGFVMVNYMGSNKGEIAMNQQKQEPTVNLLEPKAEDPAPPQLSSASSGDSAMNSTGTYTLTTADQNTMAETPVEEKSPMGTAAPMEYKPREAENRNDAQGLVTAPPTAGGRLSSPSPAYMNSTILADDKGTAAAKPLAKDENTLRRSAVYDSVETAANKSKKAKDKVGIQPDIYTKSDNWGNTPTYTYSQHGAIDEKTEADKLTVITLDDAMKSFNSGNYKAASEQFGEILKQQPNNADALYFGGISDYLNGNTKRSEKNFDKLLKEGTKFTDGSKWYKANILLKKGKRDDALKILNDLANTGGSYRERAIKKKAEIEF